MDHTVPYFHVQHGSTLTALFRFSDAADAYERSAALEPEEPVHYMALAEVLLQMGEYGRAIENSLKCIDLGHDDATANTLVGLSLLGLGQNEEAIDAFDAAINKYPGDVDAYLGKALAHLFMEEYDEALHNCTIAHSVAPWDLGHLVYSGMALEHTDNGALGKPGYKTAIRQFKAKENPTGRDYRFAILAEIKLGEGNPIEQQALEQQKISPDVVDTWKSTIGP